MDDLDVEESNRWRESMKEWQLERQRQPLEFGLPLKQRLVNLVVYDGERLKSVNEWSASICDDGDMSFLG